MKFLYDNLKLICETNEQVCAKMKANIVCMNAKYTQK